MLLVDLDTYGAAVAQTLALADEAPGIAAVARAAAQGEADAATVRQALASGPRRTSPCSRACPRPGRWSEVPSAALDAAWPAMRAAADVTVVDCGFGLAGEQSASRRDGATVSALSEADVVVAVGTAEPVGMQRLVDALSDLGEAVPGVRERLLVAVNRVRKSVAGPNPERQVADALARYAGVGQAWMIPWDPAHRRSRRVARRNLARSRREGRGDRGRRATCRGRGRAVRRTRPRRHSGAVERGRRGADRLRACASSYPEPCPSCGTTPRGTGSPTAATP